MKARVGIILYSLVLISQPSWGQRYRETGIIWQKRAQEAMDYDKYLAKFFGVHNLHS